MGILRVWIKTKYLFLKHYMVIEHEEKTSSEFSLTELKNCGHESTKYAGQATKSPVS